MPFKLNQRPPQAYLHTPQAYIIPEGYIIPHTPERRISLKKRFLFRNRFSYGLYLDFPRLIYQIRPVPVQAPAGDGGGE